MTLEVFEDSLNTFLSSGNCKWHIPNFTDEVSASVCDQCEFIMRCPIKIVASMLIDETSDILLRVSNPSWIKATLEVCLHGGEKMETYIWGIISYTWNDRKIISYIWLPEIVDTESWDTQSLWVFIDESWWKFYLYQIDWPNSGTWEFYLISDSWSFYVFKNQKFHKIDLGVLSRIHKSYSIQFPLKRNVEKIMELLWNNRYRAIDFNWNSRWYLNINTLDFLEYEWERIWAISKSQKGKYIIRNTSRILDEFDKEEELIQALWL